MSRAGRRVFFLSIAALAFVLSSADAQAATNMFLKFEEPAIAGGRTDAGHVGEIEVISWNHGFTDLSSSTRGGGGREPGHQNLTFTKYLDVSTDDLLKHCWAGKRFGKVTLRAYRADGARDNKPVLYLTITMENVAISNCSINGGPGDIPVETLTLDYGTIQYQYISQKQGDDENKVKFDRKTGKVE